MLSKLVRCSIVKSLTVLCGAAALAFSLTLSTPAHAACSAGDKAKAAGTAFIAAAKAGSSNAFANALNKYVDMRSISLFALGQHRKDLPAGQTSQFVSLSSGYVARTLAGFSKKFIGDSIRINRCSADIVNSTLLRLGARPPDKVLWRFKGGNIIDVNIQNVWLAQLLRSEYNKIIKQSGMKGLMSALRGSSGSS